MSNTPFCKTGKPPTSYSDWYSSSPSSSSSWISSPASSSSGSSPSFSLETLYNYNHTNNHFNVITGVMLISSHNAYIGKKKILIIKNKIYVILCNVMSYWVLKSELKLVFCHSSWLKISLLTLKFWLFIIFQFGVKKKIPRFNFI